MKFSCRECNKISEKAWKIPLLSLSVAIFPSIVLVKGQWLLRRLLRILKKINKAELARMHIHSA